MQARSSRRMKAPNLAELVARQFNDWIVERELGPGDPLPSEAQLIRKFGVARSVIREALVRLRALGVIEVRHGHGTFVADLPTGLLQSRIRRFSRDREAYLAHVLEMREIIETAIAELAAKRRTEEDIRRLKGALEAVRAVIASGGAPAEEDELFHVYLAQASGNPALEQLLVGLFQVLGSYRHKIWELDDTQKLSTQKQELLEAVAAGDSALARQIMEAHLRHVRLRLTHAQLTASS